jgi:hypothetical protein
VVFSGDGKYIAWGKKKYLTIRCIYSGGDHASCALNLDVNVIDQGEEFRVILQLPNK